MHSGFGPAKRAVQFGPGDSPLASRLESECIVLGLLGDQGALNLHYS
jgi:hypothetical protein